MSNRTADEKVLIGVTVSGACIAAVQGAFYCVSRATGYMPYDTTKTILYTCGVAASVAAPIIVDKIDEKIIIEKFKPELKGFLDAHNTKEDK